MKALLDQHPERIKEVIMDHGKHAKPATKPDRVGHQSAHTFMPKTRPAPKQPAKPKYT